LIPLKVLPFYLLDLGFLHKFFFYSRENWTNSHYLLFLVTMHEGKLETFAIICVAASLETLQEDPTVRALQKSMTNRLFGNYSAKSLKPPLHEYQTKFIVAISPVLDEFLRFGYILVLQ